MNEIKDKALLDVKDMMRYTGLGESSVRKLLRQPKSPFTIRIGNRLYANKRKLDSWLDQQTII